MTHALSTSSPVVLPPQYTGSHSTGRSFASSPLPPRSSTAEIPSLELPRRNSASEIYSPLSKKCENTGSPSLNKTENVKRVVFEGTASAWKPIEWITGRTFIETVKIATRPIFQFFITQTPVGEIKNKIKALPKNTSRVVCRLTELTVTGGITLTALLAIKNLSSIGEQIASPLGWAGNFVSDTWKGITWTAIALSTVWHFPRTSGVALWGGTALYFFNNYVCDGCVPAVWEIPTHSALINTVSGTASFLWNLPTGVKICSASLLTGVYLSAKVKKVADTLQPLYELIAHISRYTIRYTFN